MLANILIDEKDRPKMTFHTEKGLFDFVLMPFVLSDAPSTFQQMVNAFFFYLIDENVVVVYLHDILVHTKTWEEQCDLLQKYKWSQLELKILGFRISK